MSSRPQNSHPCRQRQVMYSFGDYNPYLASAVELPLVRENLKRFRAGEIPLARFLRQTPQFPRWREEHIQQARILLVTNEPGLRGIDKLYKGLEAEKAAEKVAEHFHRAMLSWLTLTNHPGLGAINGESPWVEHGAWQAGHPRLAACGKAGYFLVPGEEEELAGCKVLHLELSPFAQGGGLDRNPRNDLDLEYHQENLGTVERFCELASDREPRHVFIVGNRASIRRADAHGFRLDAVRTPRKDKSNKIIDLLRVALSGTRPVQVRLCRQWPVHGREPEVMHVMRPLAFELRPVSADKAVQRM